MEAAHPHRQHAARRLLLLLLLLLLPVTAVAAHGAALQRGEAEIQGVVAGGQHRVRVEDVRSCRPHLEDDGVARLEVHLLRRQLRRARGPGLDDDVRVIRRRRGLAARPLPRPRPRQAPHRPAE